MQFTLYSQQGSYAGPATLGAELHTSIHQDPLDLNEGPLNLNEDPLNLNEDPQMS